MYGVMFWDCSATWQYNQIDPLGQLVGLLSERFANLSLPLISNDRIARLPRDCQTKSNDVRVVRCPVDDQDVVGNASLSLENATEFGARKQSQFFGESSVRRTVIHL
jgi:hypothetical protein